MTAHSQACSHTVAQQLEYRAEQRRGSDGHLAPKAENTLWPTHQILGQPIKTPNSERPGTNEPKLGCSRRGAEGHGHSPRAVHEFPNWALVTLWLSRWVPRLLGSGSTSLGTRDPWVPVGLGAWGNWQETERRGSGARSALWLFAFYLGVGITARSPASRAPVGGPWPLLQRLLKGWEPLLQTLKSAATACKGGPEIPHVTLLGKGSLQVSAVRMRLCCSRVARSSGWCP